MAHVLAPHHPPRKGLRARYILETLCHLVGRVYKPFSQSNHQQMAGTTCFTNRYIDQVSFVI